MSPARLIPTLWEVPKEFHLRLGDRAGRQRAMLHEGHLLLVLHEPPAMDDATRNPRLFWRRPDGQWRSTMAGAALDALEAHLDEFASQVDACDQSEDRAASCQDHFEILQKILPLKRTVANLHLVLEEARRMVPQDRDLINLRDYTYDISRTAELLYENAKNGLELVQAQHAEEQARTGQRMALSAHRLNVLAAIFFPLATLASVFGMQLETGLEHWAAPWPFLATIILALLAGAGISLMVLKSGPAPAPKAVRKKPARS